MESRVAARNNACHLQLMRIGPKRTHAGSAPKAKRFRRGPGCYTQVYENCSRYAVRSAFEHLVQEQIPDRDFAGCNRPPRDVRTETFGPLYAIRKLREVPFVSRTDVVMFHIDLLTNVDIETLDDLKKADSWFNRFGPEQEELIEAMRAEAIDISDNLFYDLAAMCRLKPYNHKWTAVLVVQHWGVKESDDGGPSLLVHDDEAEDEAHTMAVVGTRMHKSQPELIVHNSHGAPCALRFRPDDATTDKDWWWIDAIFMLPPELLYDSDEDDVLYVY